MHQTFEGRVQLTYETHKTSFYFKTNLWVPERDDPAEFNALVSQSTFSTLKWKFAFNLEF